MKLGCRALVKAAESEIETLDAHAAEARLGGDDVVFVDLRDVRELQREGRVPGAFHAPRGMLEFWVDPDSPYHKPLFSEDKQFIFYCHSGWRSALAHKPCNAWGWGECATSEGVSTHGRTSVHPWKRSRRSANVTKSANV